jgi:activator of Hsp90 ATPase-like protein
MSDRNFTAAISVDQTPEEAFNAINNVRGWRLENIEGSTDKLGAEFSCRYQDAHFFKIKITELVPGKRIAWHVLDNRFNFTKDKNEWKGTDIIFEISKIGNKTEVRFTHRGLIPEYECFDVCSSAWGSYINGSLRSLIATGRGKPNQKETGGAKRASQ